MEQRGKKKNHLFCWLNLQKATYFSTLADHTGLSGTLSTFLYSRVSQAHNHQQFLILTGIISVAQTESESDSPQSIWLPLHRTRHSQYARLRWLNTLMWDAATCFTNVQWRIYTQAHYLIHLFLMLVLHSCLISANTLTQSVNESNLLQ